MASEKNENLRKAHLLLGIYWLYVLRRENSIPKAATEVLRVHGNSLKKEYRDRHNKAKNSVAGKNAAAGTAKAVRPASRNVRRAKASAGIRKGKLPFKMARYILKKARLF